MNRDQIANILLSAALNRAGHHGQRLGEGADGDIRGYAFRGAERILEANPTVELEDPVINQSKAAFETLVDEMLSATWEISGYRELHPAVIGELTLSRALAKLCPLFPIC